MKRRLFIFKENELEFLGKLLEVEARSCEIVINESRVFKKAHGERLADARMTLDLCMKLKARITRGGEIVS